MVLPCSALEKTLPDTVQLQIAKSLQRDLWFGKDKADHLIFSAFLTGWAYYAARKEAHRGESTSKNIAIGFSLSLGLLKETYDGLSGRGKPSLKDLGADILGTGVGYLLCTFGDQ